MWRSKKVIISVVLAVVLLFGIIGGVALAQENEDSQPRLGFLERLADKLGITTEELKDKIFDIFFTTKQVGQGTGLGLSISQNIIKLHGGNITLECPPEGGTTFLIELPLGFVEQQVEEPLFIGLDE